MAEEADPSTLDGLIATDDEYLVFCGVVGLGRQLADGCDDGNALVQRAAVAGICEPRLLRTPDAAQAAVDTCERVTASLAARPLDERRLPSVRTLRQALGYCWSVAVAADPERAMPRFLALTASPHPDVAWIVHDNRGKAHLVTLL